MRYIHGALLCTAMRLRSNGSSRGSTMPLHSGGDLPWVSLLLAILCALWYPAQCAIIIPRATCASAPLRGSSLGLPGLSSSCSANYVPAFLLLAPFLFRYTYQVFGGVCSLLGPVLACFLSASSESRLPPCYLFSPSPFPLLFSGSPSVCSWARSVRPCEGRIKRGSPAFYFSSGPVTGARPVPPSGEKVPPHCPSPT